MKKIMVNSFLCGVSVALCAMSLLQDWMGQEEYIAFAREHWVSARVSVPFAVVLLCTMVASFIALYSSALDHEGRPTRRP